VPLCLGGEEIGLLGIHHRDTEPRRRDRVTLADFAPQKSPKRVAVPVGHCFPLVSQLLASSLRYDSIFGENAEDGGKLDI